MLLRLPSLGIMGTLQIMMRTTWIIWFGMTMLMTRSIKVIIVRYNEHDSESGSDIDYVYALAFFIDTYTNVFGLRWIGL